MNVTMMREAGRLVRDNSLTGSVGLKALTLRQPWASSVFLCGKDLENRTWPARLRGTIAIHTAREQPAGAYEGGVRFIRRAQARLGDRRTCFPPLSEMPQGAIIGLVDIVDCVESSDSVWFEGPLAFKLANPRLLKAPIPVAGKRRFWRVPKSIETRINQQLGRTA